MKKFFTILSFFSLIGLSNIFAQIPINGLVGYWPFNGNANDESGNNNNAIINNTTLTTDRFGNANSAYSFSGSQQYITTPVSNGFTNSISLFAWIKTNVYTNHGGLICSRNGANIFTGISILPDGTPFMDLMTDSSGVSGFTRVTATGKNIVDNTWHLITTTYDGLTLKMYVDNLLYNQEFKGATSITLPSNFVIGYDALPGYNRYFNGVIDDVCIYNRALSQQEIADLYNGCQLSVNTQPINQTINVNNNAQFIVGSSDPNATYQWQTDLGVGFQNLNSVGQYSGTTNDTLTVSNVSLSNNNQPFRCIVSSGSCSDTSNVAVLTVNNNGCQLSVNTQPINQTINVNNNAQFIVGSSDPNATYQWQTDLGVGFQNLNSVGQYSGTTNDTLTVSNVSLSNNNQPFRCIVSSGSCSDTSNVAVLTVNNNVGINETAQDNLFSVFPNPAQSVINVKADSKLLGQVYSIYDNTGRVVLTGKLNSENTTIEFGHLSGGVYMFRIGENMRQTFKVIKAE